MMTTVLVGCGASTRRGRLPAKEKYDSNYFTLKRTYAEERDGWYILSAKYGIINPTVMIGDYDVTVGEDITADQWRDRVHRTITRHPVRWERTDRLEVLAGQRYVDPLRDRFEALPCEVVYPFDSDDLGGIGEQMAWLKENIEP